MIALLSLFPPLKKANFSLLLSIRNPGRRHKSFLPPFASKGGERAILVPGKKGGGDDSNIWEKERRGDGNGLIMGSGGVGLLAWEEEEGDTAPTDTGILVGGAFFERCVCCTERLGRQRKNDGRKKNNLPAIPLLFTNFPRHKRFFCVFGRACWYTSLPPTPQKNTGGPNIARRKIQTVGNYVAATVPLRNIKKTKGRKWAPKNEEASLETLTRQNFPKLGKSGFVKS